MINGIIAGLTIANTFIISGGQHLNTKQKPEECSNQETANMQITSAEVSVLENHEMRIGEDVIGNEAMAIHEDTDSVSEENENESSMYDGLCILCYYF